MEKHPQKYDVIVIGGGHAGIEASLAASRLACSALLLTMNLDSIALMSCNPAIGGLAKGQLVREIDALGGEMAKCIDCTALQFRRLNTRKGPAVRSSRAQADRQDYRLYMKSVLEKQSGLDIKQGTVDQLLVKDGMVLGVRTTTGEAFRGKTVIITPGTFFNGLIHIGFNNFSGGRLGEECSTKLPRNLEELGFKMGRMKTGTTPRLDGKSIDFSKLEVQKGDDPPQCFSFSSQERIKSQIPCYITYTNQKTHEIIRNNLDRSPLFTGIIVGTGVRYCPSIEDKVVKFSDRERHQIFLEPEGRNTCEFYPNGISTSLPVDIQYEILRSIKGLEKVEIMRPGYGIEHDYVDPTQLFPTLETKLISNLYLAGQINGTTGYEEAAAQGIMAGVNAALKIKGKEPFILDRSEAYIGVLIDDLVTKGTDEPYRMFTSRAEYRLVLREDNADLRLREKGYNIGLVSKDEYRKFTEKKKAVDEIILLLKEKRIVPNEINNKRLEKLGSSMIKDSLTLEELLRRPEINFSFLKEFDFKDEKIPCEVSEQVEIQIKYMGYILRQNEDIDKFKKMERVKLPLDLDFEQIPGLSSEVKEKLSRIRPISLGQALRISGVTPAAISILMIYLKKMGNI